METGRDVQGSRSNAEAGDRAVEIGGAGDRGLDEAARHIAALARRTPDDLPSNSTVARETLAAELAVLVTELKVAHEQLRQQAVDLRDARNLLESERERFRELFEVAPEGHIVTDTVGSIREANRSAAAL